MIPRHRRPTGRLPGTLLLIAVLTACGPAYRGAPLYGPPPRDDPRVAAGERVFARHCHECHPGGDAGLGFGINNKPLPGWAIELQVRHGLGAMPAFDEERIDDVELDAIVAYLMALRALEPLERR